MIRKATLTDISELLNLSYNYYLEGNVKKLKFDNDVCVQSLYRGIMEDDKDISCLVIDNKIVGFTSSHITNTLYSKDKIVECEILYVSPEYRKGSNGIKLIQNQTKLAKKAKAKYVYLGITSEIHTDRTIRLYENLGYKEIGKDFRLEV